MARLGCFEGCAPAVHRRAGWGPAERGPSRIVTAAIQTVTYFDSTFEEALALTREARDYLAYQEKAACAPAIMAAISSGTAMSASE